MKMETCQNCGRTLPVAGQFTPEGVQLDFRGMMYSHWYGQQPQETVMFTMDPFAEEIHGDMTELWLCERCFYESAMDV
jgi:hypothetical protein